MAKSKFNEKMQLAQIEREVEDVYNEGLALYFDNATITHPYDCDGLIDTKIDGKLLKLIMEYKLDKDMQNAISRAAVIVQVIYYLKKFELKGEILPNICLVGDKNECFVFHTNDVQKYLSYDTDWNIAPSRAYTNIEFVEAIAKDESINPFIFNINDNFSFKEVADKIKDLALNVQRLVNVTEHNISIVYDYFCNNVIKDINAIPTNDLVAVFINAITDRDNCYVHGKKNNILVCNGMEIPIKENAYNRFFSYFNKKYTAQEKRNFTQYSDRLIEDTNRRKKGEFYTPQLFVDKAHRMIEAALGEDWREKFVVWDNCCGTKNLTKDYSFEYLFCSTLEQGELDQCSDYNKNAVSFQYDFLNDSLDKLPASLIEALKANKPIVFLLNPPYATSGNWQGEKKTGCAKTMINEVMLADKIGACSQNLYAQFLYRIILIKREFNLTNCHIALYSPTLFLTGSSWAKFRNVYLNEFAFDNAVQFKASHFADCADNWGISFSLWHNGETADKNDFNYTLIDCAEGEITEVGNKDVYNTDGLKTASEWAKTILKEKGEDCPQMTNAINVKTEGKTMNGRLIKGGLGYFLNDSNNVDTNMQSVSIFTSAFSRGHGISILPDNFDRCTALFAARKLIEKNWINSKDEYLAPNTEHAAYNEFVNDSLIYSLFHSSSNQSSLRNVEYQEKLWNIKNEFFFMGIDEIKELAAYNDDCYNDLVGDKDRFVYNKLQGITLSEEAQKVLDMARNIVRLTFKCRNAFNSENPEYQINNWDCGWYQIKAMAKLYCKDELEAFNAAFKALADKMRPMVYELGFLK